MCGFFDFGIEKTRGIRVFLMFSIFPSSFSLMLENWALSAIPNKKVHPFKRFFKWDGHHLSDKPIQLRAHPNRRIQHHHEYNHSSKYGDT